MTTRELKSNELQRKALASLALSKETVESFYDGSRSGTAETCLAALCISHERLRAELAGAQILLEEAGAWEKEPTGKTVSAEKSSIQPTNLAVECAIGIANYCLTRFPCDMPPHPMLDVPRFAGAVQRCIDECTEEVRKLEQRITKALALTDTGSDEFREMFPSQCAGWRVVERIREILLAT